MSTHPTSATGFLISPLILGVVFIAVGIPLALGKVRPNSYYGFRVAKTMENETMWYRVNTYTGKAFMFSGVVMMLLAFVVLAVNRSAALNRSELGWAAVAVEVIPLIGAVVISSVYCYRA